MLALDQVRTMHSVYAAGFPSPKVISYGEHPGSPWAPVSMILMTRLPGEELGLTYEDTSPAQRNIITKELHIILEAMRSWNNPWGRRICSISGGAIRSIRVPNHQIGPCDSEEDFLEYPISTASSHSFETQEEYEKALATAYSMPRQHRIVFTHGDFALHNILAYYGHISGFFLVGSLLAGTLSAGSLPLHQVGLSSITAAWLPL
ncbi:Protein kinase-like domain protein [Metarhizium rileyi]|uniref:Protein kinase-like domain protein n=1 Tax=Metarhizium rileyi (strain RCEF 4871) TaxID=1649241 RepID=A0A167ISS1_METRR|nr:Protein kinase-like domain protein [Metarhizium rileyi RCEF 4871]